ncbi:hypothetical protein VTK26DRAFT_8670 [Humicola hyalothermophila]
MDSKGKTTDQPKRRACDECRGRKLACSKEVDGCARCKREGIKCVYSPQKRMGRPRKPRPAPVAEAEPEVVRKEPSKDEAATFIVPDFNFDSTFGMDLDLSFLDMGNTDVNFLELMDPNFELLPASVQPVLNQDSTSAATVSTSPPQPSQPSTPAAFWPLGSHLGEINFDEAPPSSAQPSHEVITAEDVARLFSSDCTETLPSLSPPSCDSPGTQVSTPPQDNSPQTCGCLAALYLAMQSLQSLPKEVGSAIQVTRTASKAAHDAILCPVCGNPPLTLTGVPPVNAIQNMMMLGALLPSLSNAYMQILTMIDAEAAAADAEHRKITFSLKSYGGVWGWMASACSTKCQGGVERLEGAQLEPVLWRLTVRALLKIDVYGVNEFTPGNDGCDGMQQPGLKDIINMMEERSRRRHEQVNQLVAAGILQKSPADSLDPGEKPTCMRIIDIAKRSMDELVIP